MIDLILGAARARDTTAARYVIDRVLGRVQTQAAPLAEDYLLLPNIFHGDRGLKPRTT
jgi:hypothetical protein